MKKHFDLRVLIIVAVVMAAFLTVAFAQKAQADETGWVGFSSVASPVVVDVNFTPNIITGNSAAQVQMPNGVVLGNGAGGTALTVTGGTSTDTLTTVGVTSINATGGATTNIATGAAATTNIGIVGGTNNLAGTTNINAGVNSATNINTGTSTSAVTVGNSANITNLNSATNNIGVSSGYATTNNIGTNATYASTNAIGSTNTGTTVNASGGSMNMSVANYAASLGGGSKIANTSNYVAGGTTGGGMTVVINGATSGNQAVVSPQGVITMGTPTVSAPATQSTVGMVMTNGLGNVNGMVVTESQTTMSGGLHSTSMTLNDYGATFRNPAGGPATVTGVADGSHRYDAVNFGQLKDVYGGVAAASALAGIPGPAPGKRFSIGMGYGNFESMSAFAFGAKAAVTNNIMLGVGVGFSPGGTGSQTTVSAGVGYSF